MSFPFEDINQHLDVTAGTDHNIYTHHERSNSSSDWSSINRSLHNDQDFAIVDTGNVVEGSDNTNEASHSSDSDADSSDDDDDDDETNCAGDWRKVAKESPELILEHQRARLRILLAKNNKELRDDIPGMNPQPKRPRPLPGPSPLSSMKLPQMLIEQGIQDEESGSASDSTLRRRFHGPFLSKADQDQRLIPLPRDNRKPLSEPILPEPLNATVDKKVVRKMLTTSREVLRRLKVLGHDVPDVSELDENLSSVEELSSVLQAWGYDVSTPEKMKVHSKALLSSLMEADPEELKGGLVENPAQTLPYEDITPEQD